MTADFEHEFLRERLRAIRSRLSRPVRLKPQELANLKAECQAIENILKALPRR
jgi:hypothetical protein